ncbi:MAG: peptidoglycan editing factor PgeF [Bacillota bacterium]|nr:peptidoglycan editing factor PgeF [Bacillota bacterium]
MREAIPIGAEAFPIPEKRLPALPPGFAWQARGGLLLLRATALEEMGATAAFSTRLGGVSQGPYASLNFSRSSGDRPEAVEENRRRWLAALGGGWRPAWLSQVHGSRVVEATAGAGATPEADAHWTREAGRLLGILVADCVPVLVAMPSPDGLLVGAAHAGWRGTAARVAGALVEAMREAGGRPEAGRAAVGPSIGPCCYEVGEEVFEALAAAYPGAPLRVEAPGRDHADLWEANRRALVEAGLPEEAVRVAGLCSRCHLELFYSYRGQGRSGHMAAAAGFRPFPQA